MRSYLVFAAVFVLCPFTGKTQDTISGARDLGNYQDSYRIGAGIRLGWPIAAVSVKYFFAPTKSLEFIGAPRFGGGSLTVLAAKHVAVIKRPGIYWYYGGGLDAGIYRTSRFSNFNGLEYEGSSVFTFGIVVILGIEMNIYRSPFSISLDFKPRAGIYNPGRSVLEGAATLRYTWN